MTRSRHLKHTGRSPTRAGFTTPSTGRPWPLADHPRSRGVHLVMLSRSISSAGSSPLARGLLRHHRAGQDRLRIIPARAGFTQRWRSSSPGPWDHPRSRGVYPMTTNADNVLGGSSPLARGLRLMTCLRCLCFRIIPARAGFTLADPWNPNDEPPYQTAFTFTADLALAPQSSDSAAVAQRSTRPPSEA